MFYWLIMFEFMRINAACCVYFPRNVAFFSFFLAFVQHPSVLNFDSLWRKHSNGVRLRERNFFISFYKINDRAAFN